MKKILLFCFVLLSVASFAQNDTSKYIYYRYTYGNSLDRYWAKKVLMLPSDTVYSKDGLATLIINGEIVSFIGDGTMWHRSITYRPVSPLPGDQIVLSSDSVTFTNVSTSPGAAFTGTPTVIDLGNLNYFVNTNGPYKINGIYYPSAAGTVILPVGSAGVDSGRVDLIVATPSGVGSVQGLNSDNPQAPVPDITTTLAITSVLILEDQTVPAPVNTSTNLLVWDENLGPTAEATYSTTGAVTSNPNANTAGQAFNGTKYITVTAMANNARLNWTFGSAKNKIDYTYLVGRIKLNSAWAATTTYSARLFNGATLSNAVSLITWGIVRTTTGSYMTFAIPMSQFTGSSQFTGITIQRTTVAGTTNWQLDYLQLQSGGITVQSAATLPAGNNRNIQINGNGSFATPGNDSLTLTPVNNAIWSKGGIQTGPVLLLDDPHFSNTFYRVDTFTTGNPSPNAFGATVVSAYYMYNKDINQRLTQKYATYSDLHAFVKDSIKISPANSDLYGASQNKMAFEKYPGYSGRSIVQNGSDPSIPADGGSAVFGGVEIFGSTSSSNYTRIKGYTYGHMSYLLASQYDTVDNFIGYGSSGKGANNARVRKWYHLFGGRPSTQIDSLWNVYSVPGTNEYNYFDGKVAIGGGHTGPSHPLEVYGQVQIKDGTESNGYVFTSDANGVGSWQPAGGGGGGGSDSPDRINGTATADVTADMGSHAFQLNNATGILLRAPSVGLLQIGASGHYFEDDNATPRGLEYDADYSANYTSRSLTDKAYVDAAVAGGVGGLTVGTTTITSGTNTRILYNNSGVLGEYTVTGSGTTAVLSTSPTFTTKLTTPLILGGTGTTQTLTFQTTSGVGASGADHIFLVGNNGGTEAMRITNAAKIQIQGATANQALNTPGLWVSGGMDIGSNFADAGVAMSIASGRTYLFNMYDAGAANARMFLRSDGYLSLGNFTTGTASHFEQRIIASNKIGYTLRRASGQSVHMMDLLDESANVLSGWNENGQFTNKIAYAAKATSYTTTVNDATIKVTATGQTITLPTSVGADGKVYTIKLTAAGSCTVATTSSQTIDGSTTYSLASQYKYVTVQSDGANWIVIANN